MKKMRMKEPGHRSRNGRKGVMKRLIKIENYSFVAILSKILQPVFNILFYISVFLMFLMIILRVILIGVNIPVDEMLLPPFMDKIQIESESETEAEIAKVDTVTETADAYVITLGNGVRIVTLAENVTLQNIKSVLFAEIHVLIFVLLTIAPIFKFFSSLLININERNYFAIRNARYVMFIGLCVSIGTMLIRFMMQFYNYYLLNRFAIYAPQEISLHLRVDVLSGVTGLVIILIGLIYAHICHIMTVSAGMTPHNGGNGENSGSNEKGIAPL